MNTPTINGGYELSPGDELDTSIAPDCCDTEMLTLPKITDQQTYRCDECRTVLVVGANGLVYDIR